MHEGVPDEVGEAICAYNSPLSYARWLLSPCRGAVQRLAVSYNSPLSYATRLLLEKKYR